MRILIFSIIFCIVLVSFLASPAPLFIEVSDVILIVLPCILAVLSLTATTHYTLHKTEYSLFVAIMFYLSYLLLSILIALLHGVPFLNILRAIGPYLNFFPLLFICLLPNYLLTIGSISFVLIFVGSVQAIYQIYVYAIHSHEVVNTLGVLINRITLVEPRTTLPIVLSITVLPLALLTSKNRTLIKHSLLQFVAVCLILLGIVAGAVTLTRSIILSILFGWLTFIVLYLYQQTLLNRSYFFKVFKKMLLCFILLIGCIIVLSSFEKIQLIEQGLLSRFYQSEIVGDPDYSNGRIYDEWIPALNRWLNSGILGLFFGIGAGSSFTIASGEERTYIHNLCIYNLVYGGLYGLLAYLFLYYTIFKTLLYRAWQTNQTLYIAAAALFSSIFFYGQLFAVHKGLAFNVMLFLMMVIALHQPKIKTNQQYS